MLLSRLLAVSNDAGRGSPAAVVVVNASADPEILGLTADSRAVRAGFLFAALPGVKTDGRAFIAGAVAAGAAAVLVPAGTVFADGAPAVPVIEAAEPRAVFAHLAAAFFGRQPEIVVAVTGTNGKTSTVTFARQIWAAAGKPAASLGTLGLIGPGLDGYGAMTTPDPVALHADLARIKDAGIERLAMEASSHGLDQRRSDGVRLAAGGFTNLTRDHLDYHGDMETYFAAKAGLFDRLLPPGAAAVLNADAPDFDRLKHIAEHRGLRVVSYGEAGEHIRLRQATATPRGRLLDLQIFGDNLTVELPLAGAFQTANALCALGLVVGGDRSVDIFEAAQALSGLDGAPGRLQHVADAKSGAPIFVDYAHTPDALETVLTALRPHAAGRLVCVFGCGGDRDSGKRPVMGELAARLADRAIVTDDNPRSEDAPAIRRAVLAGATGELEEIGDRRAAIRAAVAELRAGDVLVIAGKGHEQGQIVGAEVRPFDDAAEARSAVEEAGR